MKAIVATDKLWGIGYNNRIPFRIKEDMEFFKSMTIGKVVVMGRKTLESLPNGFLKDRVNLVISSTKHEKAGNNIIAGIDDINEEIKKYDTNNIYIIGGESIYNKFINRCDTIYVTRYNRVYECDTFMKNIAFENFVMSENIKFGKHDGSEYVISKWIASEVDGYKSVLWFNDMHDNIIFAYTNDFLNWKSIYTNSYVAPNKFNNLFDGYDLTNVVKVYQNNNGVYKAKIEVSSSDEINKAIKLFKLAAFGDTYINAVKNICNAITSITK